MHAEGRTAGRSKARLGRPFDESLPAISVVRNKQCQTHRSSARTRQAPYHAHAARNRSAGRTQAGHYLASQHREWSTRSNCPASRKMLRYALLRGTFIGCQTRRENDADPTVTTRLARRSSQQAYIRSSLKIMYKWRDKSIGHLPFSMIGAIRLRVLRRLAIDLLVVEISRLPFNVDAPLARTA